MRGPIIRVRVKSDLADALKKLASDLHVSLPDLSRLALASGANAISYAIEHGEWCGKEEAPKPVEQSV